MPWPKAWMPIRGRISDRRSRVPDRFAERGAPLVTVTIEGGVVQNVAIENGPARVVVRDYDTEGSDPTTLHTDANGDRYVRAEWSHPLPPQGG
jgi:hypothetical protein